jgi:hypothetical protein
MDRRRAVSNLMWLGGAHRLAGLATAIASPRPSTLPESGRDDEAYWRGVRAAFEHTAGQTNLVTAVRGVTPRAVREAVATESERLNAFRPRPTPDPEWRARVRGTVASFIGAAGTEVALLRNTTEGVTTVLLNWPMRRGDEVLTSGVSCVARRDRATHLSPPGARALARGDRGRR